MSQPTDGGVAAVVRDLALHQAGRGGPTHVATPGDSPLAAALSGTGVRVHPWAARRSPGPATLREAQALARIVDRVRPDVVVLHSSKAGLAGRLALRGSRPTVFVPHAWSFEAVAGAVRLASVAWERHAARWTHQLVCLTEEERAVGSAHGVSTEAAVVVPNGVDTNRFVPGDQAAARAAIGIEPGPLAVCLARLSREKGQDLLIRAWPSVRRRVPEAQLALVGQGPLAAQLQAAAEMVPGVFLAGPTSRPSDWYQAADVVVCPSLREGMALVPLEAMACATSVVGTDVGGLAATVADAGAVVPPHAFEALVDELVLRLLDPARAQAEGRRGRRRMEQHFDANRALGRLDEVITRTAAPCTQGAT